MDVWFWCQTATGERIAPMRQNLSILVSTAIIDNIIGQSSMRIRAVYLSSPNTYVSGCSHEVERWLVHLFEVLILALQEAPSRIIPLRSHCTTEKSEVRHTMLVTGYTADVVRLKSMLPCLWIRKWLTYLGPRLQGLWTQAFQMRTCFRASDALSV